MKLFLKVIVLTAVIFGALTAMLGGSIFTASSALLTAIILVLVRDGIAAHSKLFGFLTTASAGVSTCNSKNPVSH